MPFAFLRVSVSPWQVFVPDDGDVARSRALPAIPAIVPPVAAPPPPQLNQDLKGLMLRHPGVNPGLVIRVNPR